MAVLRPKSSAWVGGAIPRFALGLLFCGLSAACGSRGAVARPDAADVGTAPVVAERCNYLDDNGNGQVDEGFRDAAGLYVGAAHCGACDRPCAASRREERRSTCQLVDAQPVCAATECIDGYAPSPRGRCVPIAERLCLPCTSDADCGELAAARCLTVAGESRCGIDCQLGCPKGYGCGAEGACVPDSGSCSCGAEDDFDLACTLQDPRGSLCVGKARCELGKLSTCEPAVEVCDRQDNDCDGTVDEDFRDGLGAYGLDISNCGSCGVDCRGGSLPNGLVCGGDPFAPSCVIRCDDAENGLQIGDHLDADRDPSNGCECTVSALVDLPGPVLGTAAQVDPNCDGADGVVLESVYVATDGDDANPGSPTRPLRSINAALRLARDSLTSASPRRTVFVASGAYAEAVQMLDGLALHGGYRRDYRAVDPAGYGVEVRATSTSGVLGGAALSVRAAGIQPTRIDGITFVGRDAAATGEPAFGALLIDVGPLFSLVDSEIRAGRGGAGSTGTAGATGSASPSTAGNGVAQSLAAEDAVTHRCLGGGANQVPGGRGGQNTCDGVPVAGGSGGGADCPDFAMAQGTGASGSAVAGLSGGAGGVGGQDAQGPIFTSLSCPQLVCCGATDFTVASPLTKATAGRPGQDGSLGAGGSGCVDPLGRFEGESWVAGVANPGRGGSPGSGGGGGGAGGGIEVGWIAGLCALPDGLGGTGGGGGAGGCGGGGGLPGSSGGASVALVVRYTAAAAGLPTLSGLNLVSGDGAPGGAGGAGGAGGRGGAGGAGGAIANTSRTILPLGGASPGQAGGKGGEGGRGGAGGGGCGGSSVGLWLDGGGSGGSAAAAAWRSGNRFQLGRGGAPGVGGNNDAAASGTAGGASDVVVR